MDNYQNENFNYKSNLKTSDDEFIFRYPCFHGTNNYHFVCAYDNYNSIKFYISNRCKLKDAVIMIKKILTTFI